MCCGRYDVLRCAALQRLRAGGDSVQYSVLGGLVVMQCTVLRFRYARDVMRWQVRCERVCCLLVLNSVTSSKISVFTIVAEPYRPVELILITIL